MTDRAPTIREMAEQEARTLQCDFNLGTVSDDVARRFERFGQAVAVKVKQETREQCAQIAEQIIEANKADCDCPISLAAELAAAIRASENGSKEREP